jgi:hypothetical protein
LFKPRIINLKFTPEFCVLRQLNFSDNCYSGKVTVRFFFQWISDNTRIVLPLTVLPNGFLNN